MDAPERRSQEAPRSGVLRSRARLFALSALSFAALVTGIGWWTGLGRAFRGLLLALTTIAFLPFLIIAGLLLFLVMLALAIAIAGEEPGHIIDASAAEGIVELARRLLVGYYPLLFRQRHPLPLGMGAGLVLGTVVVFGLLSIFVVPREACTLQRLVAAKRDIDRYYELRGQYPPPVEGQALSISLVAPGEVACQSSCHPTSESQILLDGFGRPIVYETSQTLSRFASYRLKSQGADGRTSSDDLCVSGATRAQRALDRIATDLQLLSALESLLPRNLKSSSERSWRPWWAALRFIDCRN